MNTFRFDPVRGKENDQNWRASSVREPMFARANSHADALEKVVRATHEAVRRDAKGSDTATPPWRDSALVTCTIDESVDVPEGFVRTKSGKLIPIE